MRATLAGHFLGACEPFNLPINVCKQVASRDSPHPFGSLCIQCSQRCVGECDVISMELRFSPSDGVIPKLVSRPYLLPGAMGPLRARSWPVLSCSAQTLQADQEAVVANDNEEATCRGTAPTHCHLCERQFRYHSCQCQCSNLCAETMLFGLA